MAGDIRPCAEPKLSTLLIIVLIAGRLLTMSSLKLLSQKITAYTLVSAGLWMGTPLTLATLAQEDFVPPDRGSPGRLVGGGTHYTPPDRGIPGRREGGGTRGGCMSPQPLTALMPMNGYGETLAAYPTFYFYVPDFNAEAAEFVLLNEAGDEIYASEFQVTGEPGVIAIHLPSTVGLPELAIGENYEWIFSLICDRTDRSGDSMVSGWLQRIETPATLAMELETLPESDRPALYAQSGLWYEAIASLADLRLANPTSAAIQEQWSSLLSSVELEYLAEAEFLPLTSVEDGVNGGMEDGGNSEMDNGTGN